MSVVDEIVRKDNSDLFECIFPYIKNIKRDMAKVSFLYSCKVPVVAIEWKFWFDTYGSWPIE